MKIIILFLLTCGHLNASERWNWFWTCNVKVGKCERTQIASSSSGLGQEYSVPKYSTLALCRLTCGNHGALWPLPTGKTVLGNQLMFFSPSSINFDIVNADAEAELFLRKCTKIFINNLLKQCGGNCSEAAATNVMVTISVIKSDVNLHWSTDESYQLDVWQQDPHVVVDINSPTIFGARHGLETLSQLTAPYVVNAFEGRNDEQKGLAMVTLARISDKPVFKHRGVLLDTARNFLPIHTIKRQIDAMAASKLNVLHWHSTDSQSFPLELPSVPQLAIYGAYSNEHVYSPSDVRNLIAYAKLRGVRILLEIDAPSHAANGWQWGPSLGVGNLSVCTNQKPWRSFCIQPPCGQLNPVNPFIYDVLSKIYGDVIELFSNPEMFHMGGDEVFLPCWNATEEIVDYMHRNNRGRSEESFLDLWAEYQKGALEAFDKNAKHANSSFVVWSSMLTDHAIIDKYLPKNRYIIQTWVPSTTDLPFKLLDKGYRIIVSTKDAWYLDHGVWGITQYYTWRKVYSNQIPRHPHVLGGEVCMWGELVDEQAIDAKIWPRAAAAAERLWTDPNTNTAEAEARFYTHRERLVNLGIRAEALTPRWCYQNEGQCL